MRLAERDIEVSSLNLVIQHGPERDWNWSIVNTIKLTAPALT